LNKRNNKLSKRNRIAERSKNNRLNKRNEITKRKMRSRIEGQAKRVHNNTKQTN
jgi:hypothetical protein